MKSISRQDHYDWSTSHNGCIIKRYVFLVSAGMNGQTEASTDVTYYHYHVFETEDSDPLHDAPSLEMAQQFIEYDMKKK